jgi:hypothetical protein
MADVQLLHVAEWPKEIVPRYAVDFILPIRRKIRLFRSKYELLYKRENRHQRAADLRRGITQRVKRAGTDMEAEAGLFAGTNDKHNCPPVENDVGDKMPQPFGCLDKVGQVWKSCELVE